ncbi:MAG: adenosylcobinamide-phosphate synthase CbiB [Desulfobulbaceae bacterium]
MALEYQVMAALILDGLAGDPRWLPHPVKLIAKGALVVEAWSTGLRIPARVAGILTVCVVLAATTGGAFLLLKAAYFAHPLAGDGVSVLLLYTCFAVRDMVAHSRRVHEALVSGDLEEARSRVGMIVGRDVRVLDEPGVIRAAVESVAENTVDGVTAPLFWAMVAGPVGALLYKAVNTMDSLFGYKNERYLHFGRAAARLDDLANWLPARLTGPLIVLGSALLGLRVRNGWRMLFRDRANHSSPNSAWSEAPVAGALGIMLGGPVSYAGRMEDYPTIGEPLEEPVPGHIQAANRLLVVTVVLVFLLCAGIRMMVV